VILADNWTDFCVIDCGGGEKLERWGDVILRRPDPQAIWPRGDVDWRADATYQRSATGGGEWHFAKRLPDQWHLRWEDLNLIVRPTGFKHTGLFPEQAANWAWMRERIIEHPGQVSLLNLFGYTGAASVACAAAGAKVTHVDASRGMVAWCRENAVVSGLADAPIRTLVDDCTTFLQREIRRGNRYQAILLDPPSYGRGEGKQVWRLEDDIAPFLALCRQVLADDACFVVFNCYTTGLQPAVVRNLLSLTMPAGDIDAQELCLPVTSRPITLPCGVTGRWTP